MNENVIYSRDEAADILDIFEELLIQNGIKVPSPEDDERDADNEAALYGTTYYSLLRSIETIIIDVVRRGQLGYELKPYTLSGNRIGGTLWT